MRHSVWRSALGLFSSALVAGCATDYAGYAEYEGDEAETENTYGAAEQAVNACAGDDLQYDFNGFAASLAVAIANELGHWDVATDFVVSNGKLALSPAGLARCGASGCGNIKDLLLMQDDATSGIPNHSPSVFRQKLSGWYQAQLDKLTELTTAAVFPPGTYRFKGRQSGKYIVVDNASMADNALIEQKGALNATADWEVSVVGTKHRLRNVASGKCLDLKTDSSSNTDMVQRTCSSADSQLFKMSKSGEGTAFLFETKYAGKGLFVAGHSTGDDAKITQANFDKNMYSSQWNATLLNGTQAQGLFKGMYTLTASHSSKVMGVTSATVGASVAQYPASASNPMLNWYALPMGTLKYQFVNRSSGKCMALETDTATANIVQKDCANSDTQVFTLASTGSPDQYTLKSKHGKLLEVDAYKMTDGAVIKQAAATAADPQRRFKLTPILAGEPHRLSFSHKTNDAACGDYFWYNVTQPNGLPLANPAETFIQLIFAGGKKAMGGTDENPFIAQVSTGTQVAIDPSGFMLPGQGDNTGSCIATDLLYDSTKMADGDPGPPVIDPFCCIKSNGVNSVFAKSSWSPTTFICK